MSTGSPEVAARRALAVLGTAMVLALSTWFSTAAALPSLGHDLDLSTATRRWVVVVVQIGFAVGALVAAISGLAERVGPRRLAAVGAVAAGAANAAPLVVATTSALVTSRALVGASLALVYPPLLKAAAAWTVRARGAVMGAMIAALTLGSASPHLVNGLGGATWRTTLAVTSVAALLASVLVGAVASDGPHLRPTSAFRRHQVRSVVSRRELRLTCLGYLGHMWELYAGWAAMAPFMLAVHGDPEAASLATFAVIAAGSLGAWRAGTLGDRVARHRVAAAAMVVSCSLVAVVGLLEPVPALAVTVAVVWGGAVIADGGQFPALATEHADPREVGTVLSIQLALGFTVTAVATWVIPAVHDAAGWGWAFLALAPGPALGALAMRRLGADAPAHLRRGAVAPPPPTLVPPAAPDLPSILTATTRSTP